MDDEKSRLEKLIEEAKRKFWRVRTQHALRRIKNGH